MASTYTGPPRASHAAALKWFETTTVVSGDFRELLEKYSHIPPEQVDQHVIQLVSAFLLSAALQVQRGAKPATSVIVHGRFTPIHAWASSGSSNSTWRPVASSTLVFWPF